MTVAVVVPWRPGCPWREAAWRWVQARYAEAHPDWGVVTGSCPEGPFSRSQAIVDGARRTDAEVLVVADADVWCDPQPAVDKVAEKGWAVPHLMIHRLAKHSTRMLETHDWRHLDLSGDNPQDRHPYRGNETGTLVVVRRDVLEAVPPDPRFVGWGQEDLAWGHALRTLVGKPWRGEADLVHLWHPPQPRLTRVVGSEASKALWLRYRAAARNPDRMRELVEEAKTMIPFATTTISVSRSDAADGAEPYDPADATTWTTVTEGVRAHISTSAGQERLGTGAQEVVETRLDCDPTDLGHNDRVVDERTGETYEVLWVRDREGLGLAYTQAGLRLTVGVA